ncbi:pentapeptide repeat-containing protein [Nocardiopsis exhalans]|uniref:Pentapeptide repeat-containing protein n=1 Tax=Nocardiopsis exhalans TaxID=163604 RepID=A0ABY5CZX7_9ACTN|nr:pentapeptide repeat-containing protein [Nocardiopsis exhalans]USY17449.1 pentapeptide repeat-containing protein [Nocardiopsis exhalans]
MSTKRLAVDHLASLGLPANTALTVLAILWFLVAVSALTFLYPDPEPTPGRPLDAPQQKVRLTRLVFIAWIMSIWVILGILAATWFALGHPPYKPPAELTSKMVESMVTRAFAVIAGLGGVALLVTAYRRQKTTEQDSQRDTSRLFTERFASASSQFGHEEAAVKLAGVHALAHVADQAPSISERQMVIDVLCAFLRMPSPQEPPTQPTGAGEKPQVSYQDQVQAVQAYREVRHTIIDVIASRLRTNPGWQELSYDFSRVTFDGANFTRIRARGVSFRQASFRANRHGNVYFDGVHLHQADFTGAHFTGGIAAKGLPGTISFHRATLTGCSFQDTVFDGARVQIFDGATLDSTSFDGAQLKTGSIEIRDSTLKGTTTFRRARFTGTPVLFLRCTFQGKIDLYEAWFTDEGTGFIVNQGGITGEVSFQRTLMDQGRVHFAGVTLDSGTIDFRYASLNEPTLHFNLPRSPTLRKGTVDFTAITFPNPEHARGLRPQGLVEAERSGTVRVLWPPQWDPASADLPEDTPPPPAD